MKVESLRSIFPPERKKRKKTFRVTFRVSISIIRLLLAFGKKSKTHATEKEDERRSRREERGILMNLEEWYFQTPVVTRCYLTMSFLITAGCALEVRF